MGIRGHKVDKGTERQNEVGAWYAPYEGGWHSNHMTPGGSLKRSLGMASFAGVDHPQGLRP